MRVCVVTPRYPPNIHGGGEISCSLLARELSNYVDVEVVSFDGNVTSKSEVDGVRVIRKRPIASHKLKTPVNLQAYLFLKKKVNDYDVFHTYNMDVMPAVGLLTKFYGIKSIATLNGAVYSSSQGGWYDAYKTSLNPKVKLEGAFIISRNELMIPAIRNITMFTTLCPFYKERFVADGFPSDRIEVIPNMIDPKFKPVHIEKTTDGINILYIGNFRWRKGLDTLLSAYSILKKQNVALTVVGWKGYGMDDSKMKNLIRKLGIKNKIQLYDKMPYEETRKIYAKADIFVNAYRYPEPIQRTILEALESTTCVVATGTNNYSPIIRNMKDGLLVYPCTAEELSEKLQMLIDNPDLRRMLANNGQRRVWDVCAPEKIITQYIAIYERLLSR